MLTSRWAVFEEQAEGWQMVLPTDSLADAMRALVSRREDYEANGWAGDGWGSYTKHGQKVRVYVGLRGEGE